MGHKRIVNQIRESIDLRPPDPAFSKQPFNWGRWLIFTVGALFSVYGLFLGVLLSFGDDVTARVTSYRREYGERNETIRNQYTYLYGYEFMVNGKKYSGTGQRIGNSVYLKPGNSTFMHVKYLPCCPYLNTDTEGNKTMLNMLISLLVGIGLIRVSTRMTKKRKNQSRKHSTRNFRIGPPS